MNELDKNIRKLRKKLRQIDQLTVLTRQLNDEENEKVTPSFLFFVIDDSNSHTDLI